MIHSRVRTRVSPKGKAKVKVKEMEGEGEVVPSPPEKPLSGEKTQRRANPFPAGGGNAFMVIAAFPDPYMQCDVLLYIHISSSPSLGAVWALRCNKLARVFRLFGTP
jgi:hypothetical protein